MNTCEFKEKKYSNNIFAQRGEKLVVSSAENSWNEIFALCC